MSSFPEHVKNIEALQEMGFDMSEYYEDGEVSIGSWCYDELVYIMSDVIVEMKKQGFECVKQKDCGIEN